jgi:hypothetical protein
MNPSTPTRFAAVPGPAPLGGQTSTYQPGVCNIGPAEIRTRRRFGHLGLVVTVVFLAFLLAVHAPPLVRLLVALPAAGSAIGYLQAHFRFCAGFGVRGVFNFGDIVGTTTSIEDAEARRRDAMRSRQLYLGALAIGVLVGIAAALLPV